MSSNPLANLGDLTKPATVLVEKISEALGGIFKPYRIVRVAKAEAEAEQIQAESQIQVTDLQRRALYRFLQEEAKKQSNIEAITQRTLPLLEEKALPQNVEDDWITNFFDKCRIVSDDDMQRLWSRILAGEANSPGTFSKRTVNLLADLEKTDAELFTHLCGFCWTQEDEQFPLVFGTRAEPYSRSGIHFDSVCYLESLGLVLFPGTQFQREGLPRKTLFSYHNRPLELTFGKDANNVLPIGYVLLTRAGQELARVSGSLPVDGFFESMCARWAPFLVPEPTAEPTTPSAT
jgi:hypothetical protein